MRKREESIAEANQKRRAKKKGREEVMKKGKRAERSYKVEKRVGFREKEKEDSEYKHKKFSKSCLSVEGCFLSLSF